MTVNEWLGMVQRVREMIVCEKINDALASVKALEDGMTENLDEDRDHYFNPPASSFHDVRNEANAGTEHNEANAGPEHTEGVESEEDCEDGCDDRPPKRQRQWMNE